MFIVLAYKKLRASPVSTYNLARPPLFTQMRLKWVIPALDTLFILKNHTVVLLSTVSPSSMKKSLIWVFFE